MFIQQQITLPAPYLVKGQDFQHGCLTVNEYRLQAFTAFEAGRLAINGIQLRAHDKGLTICITVWMKASLNNFACFIILTCLHSCRYASLKLCYTHTM
jgi:hypothetical protein